MTLITPAADSKSLAYFASSVSPEKDIEVCVCLVGLPLKPLQFIHITIKKIPCDQNNFIDQPAAWEVNLHSIFSLQVRTMASQKSKNVENQLPLLLLMLHAIKQDIPLETVQFPTQSTSLSSAKFFLKEFDKKRTVAAVSRPTAASKYSKYSRSGSCRKTLKLLLYTQNSMRVQSPIRCARWGRDWWRSKYGPVQQLLVEVNF